MEEETNKRKQEAENSLLLIHTRKVQSRTREKQHKQKYQLKEIHYYPAVTGILFVEQPQEVSNGSEQQEQQSDSDECQF